MTDKKRLRVRSLGVYECTKGQTVFCRTYFRRYRVGGWASRDQRWLLDVARRTWIRVPVSEFVLELA